MSSLSSKIKSDLGTVKFLKSEWADKHVVDAMAYIAKVSKEQAADLKQHIEGKVAEFSDIAKYSNILYETIAKNIIESELFNALGRVRDNIADLPAANETFDPVIFMALVRSIKTEHPRFFPLRNFSDSKHLYNPRWILVPTQHEGKQYNSVTTAAATASGEFIFSTKFMQTLLDFAHIKGLKPKSKKYSNNGGPFPPGYAYIEFLIIHELLHYTQSDFHYGKIYKDVSPKILNWVGDFRSNYELVKGGYEQLPMGLYSDHINYDRQNTYREMIDLVKSELDKLPEDQQDKIQDYLDKASDDHDQTGEDLESSTSDSDEPSEEDVEKAAKGTRESMDEKSDSKGDDPGEKTSPKRNGDPGKSNITRADTKFDPSLIKPKYSWTDLLSKAVKVAAETEETYAKPNRRSITGVMLARTRGSAAMKPGDIESPMNVKLQIVVDSSGSMSEDLPRVYANIKKLLASRETSPVFYLVRYSDTFDIWSCNTKNDKATNLENKEIGKTSTIFTTTFGGGTQFDSKVTNVILDNVKDNFTTVFFSDSDVLVGENFVNLKRLIANKVYVIFNNKTTYNSAIAALKSASFNISHL